MSTNNSQQTMGNNTDDNASAQPDWKAIRTKAGYKRPALARRLNVHPATIDRFEKNDPIQGETTRARLALEYRKLAAETAATLALPLDGAGR